MFVAWSIPTWLFRYLALSQMIFAVPYVGYDSRTANVRTALHSGNASRYFYSRNTGFLVSFIVSSRMQSTLLVANFHEFQRGTSPWRIIDDTLYSRIFSIGKDVKNAVLILSNKEIWFLKRDLIYNTLHRRITVNVFVSSFIAWLVFRCSHIL